MVWEEAGGRDAAMRYLGTWFGSGVSHESSRCRFGGGVDVGFDVGEVGEAIGVRFLHWGMEK